MNIVPQTPVDEYSSGQDDTSEIPPMPSSGLIDPTSGFGMGGQSNLGYLAQQSADLVKWELESQDVIEELGHFMRGEFYDLEKGKWLSTGKFLMSDEGVRAFITRLRSRFHKGIILSNFNEGEIRENMFRIHMEVLAFLYQDWDKYNISLSDCSLLRY